MSETSNLCIRHVEYNPSMYLEVESTNQRLDILDEFPCIIEMIVRW